MSKLPPRKEDFNPYRAPAAEVGEAIPSAGFGEGSKDEAIRRKYLNHEASVRSVGSLCYVGVICLVFPVVSVGGSLLSNRQTNPAMASPFAAGAFAVLVGMGILFGGIGYGLRALLPWGRWTCLALTLFNIASGVLRMVGPNPPAAPPGQPAASPGMILGFTGIGLIIPVYIAYLMLSSKAKVVFSGEYRDIVARTPHIKYKTSLILKILVGLVVLLVVIAFAAAIFGRR